MIPFGEEESLGPPSLLSRGDLIQVILRLQFEGWQCALSVDAGLTCDCSERYMNGRLYQGMLRLRNSLGLSNVFIVEKPGVRANADAVQPDGEPDVIVLLAEFGANEPHAIVECKRLDPVETPKRLRGEYFRSGMERFIRGRYGRGHDIDFMVAYVLSGDESAAMDDLNVYLHKVGRSECCLRENRGFEDLGFVAESDHVRTSDEQDFRLLHSFLCFRKNGC